ncbi:class A beta-lactamase [Herbiconiux sp. KACC 21604]|uniref:class A beta-lactamase n=1 Tax=unclassified Herbiconiux TaxID=2618217 RepID=UPI001492F8C2|nr:class A beta-lactamase [Herbiconiux sp. SALV-R1]QJU52665.1 class A beta-lactamase [Herbiconiux sp. SALV-R1]WPO87561.1 class A beta-lactamase [Herbiconiux sp. KACC 21604]
MRTSPRAADRMLSAGVLASVLSASLLLAACSAGATDAPPHATGSPSAVSSPDSGTSAASPAAPTPVDLSGRLTEIENEFAVTIGVSAVSESGVTVEYRAAERFGYASTIKTFAAGLMLATTTPERRSTTLTWTQADLDTAGYSPVTQEHLTTGLTLAQLAEAAVRSSDNTALNLVLGAVGGPDAVQRFLRELGDDATMVSAFEPELNTVTPGDPSNTTTPGSYGVALRELLTGDALSETDARILQEWMTGNSTGDTLIRAAAPEGWGVADKSGGAGGIRNDIALVTTEAGEDVVVVILTATNDPSASYDDAAVAEAARAVLAAFG